MPDSLEGPNSWQELYLARGDEIGKERPVFTGDVFRLAGTVAEATRASSTPTGLLVLQHPCALRIDGVNLVERLLVAEVSPATPMAPGAWSGNYRVMPLPELLPLEAEDAQHYAATFTSLRVVAPLELALENRVATMTHFGVNLMLQRWVHHNSRVIVATHKFADVTIGPYEEAELTEEWVSARLDQGHSQDAALMECHAFLREASAVGGPRRQELLADPQRRSEVRRAARSALATDTLTD